MSALTARFRSSEWLNSACDPLRPLLTNRLRTVVFAARRLLRGSSEPEQTGQGFRVDADRVGIAQGFQLFGWSQQQLFDDEVRDFVNPRSRFVAGLRGKRRQLEVEALQFGPTYVIEMLPERHDGWNCAASLKPCVELAQLVGDDGLGASNFGGTALDVFAHRGLQIVDVVQEDLLDLSCSGFNVSRERDIDE